jgi:DNA-binding transcriptional LysR family regulator
VRGAGADFAVEDGPEFEHYYFTLEAAVAGLGVAIAPWHLVMDDIRAGRLVAPLGFDESSLPVRGQAARRRRCATGHLLRLAGAAGA